MNRLYFIKSKLNYLRNAKHYKGHGIHSPFTFHTLNFVLYENKPYYCFDYLKKIRKDISKNKEVIAIKDLGTGKDRSQSIRSILANAATSRKDGELLFRLAHSIGAKNILELGTNLGLSTMYLASTNSKAKVYTIEGDQNILKHAKAHFNTYGFNNIIPTLGNIDNCLEQLLKQEDKFDFIFFDANHTYHATINYFLRCIDKLNDNAICVFHDIHTSKEMTNAWNEIKQHERITLSIDIFKMGIVWCNPNIPKQDYIITF